MKVLVDNNGVVLARGEKNVNDALERIDATGKSVEEYPDNTTFERVDGGFVVPDRQRTDAQWQAEKEAKTKLLKRREKAIKKKGKRLESLAQRMRRVEDILGIDND